LIYQYLQCRLLQRRKNKHWIHTSIIYKVQLFRKLKKGLWKHVCVCFLWLVIKDNGIIHSPKIHFKLLPFPLYYKITHIVVNQRLPTITVFDIDHRCLFNRLGTASKYHWFSSINLVTIIVLSCYHLEKENGKIRSLSHQSDLIPGNSIFKRLTLIYRCLVRFQIFESP